MTKKIKQKIEDPSALPDAELEVMACLWNMQQATAREIREQMDGYRPMAHGSMVTLLKRLEAKGLVSKQKAPTGKAFVYRTSTEPKPTYRKVMQKMLQRIFGGDSLVLVSSIFETQPPKEDEIEQLEEYLAQLKRKNTTKGK
jgi:BlaI family transcriptional regulator, penicillinase repressor